MSPMVPVPALTGSEIARSGSAELERILQCFLVRARMRVRAKEGAFGLSRTLVERVGASALCQ